MKPNEMTLAEFLAWNGKGGSKGLEEYKKLLTRKHWLTGRLAGQSEKMLDAQDSISVFDESEHDDPQFIKYVNQYHEALEKSKKYLTQLCDVNDQISEYMK